MALTTPLYLQNLAHSAGSFRELIAAVTAGEEGVFNRDELEVTQSGTPGMSVDVAAGSFVILDETSLLGSYFAHNDSSETVTIAASDLTNPRVDLIVARINDSFQGDATNSATIEAVTGTPAASPSAPAAPARSIVLAEVAVAAAATSILDANITDERTRLSFLDTARLVAFDSVTDSALSPTPESPTGLSASFTAKADRDYLIEVETDVMWLGSDGDDVRLELQGLDSTVNLADGNDWMRDLDGRQSYAFAHKTSGESAGSKSLTLELTEDTAGTAIVNWQGNKPFVIKVWEIGPLS